MFASRQLFVAHAVVDCQAKFAEDAVAHVAFQSVEIPLEIEQIFLQTTCHPGIVHAQEQRTALRIEHAAHHLHEVVGLFLQVGAHIVVGWEHRARLKFQTLSFASEGIALWQIHLDVEQLFDLSANLLLMSLEGESRSEVERENQSRQLHESVRRRIILHRLPQKVVLSFIACGTEESHLGELFAQERIAVDDGVGIANDAFHLLQIDLAVHAIVFDLSEQLAARVEVLHRVFVLEHTCHDVCHREKGIGFGRVLLQHRLMVEELEQEMHIVVDPHHHLFRFQGSIVAVARFRVLLIHLTIGIVHEEIFCHSLHVHRHRREIHGFGAERAHVVHISQAHLHVIARSALQVVRHIDQHHIALLGDTAVELSCIAIEVAVGEAIFHHEILHPFVHFLQDERLRVEEQAFVFRFGVSPSHHLHLEEERASFKVKRIEGEIRIIEKHPRVLSFDVGVDPSFAAVAFLLDDAIKSRLIAGVSALHAHFHRRVHIGDGLAHHGSRCHHLLVRREERAFHIAPPSGPFRERSTRGNAVARRFLEQELQTVPVHQSCGQHIAHRFGRLCGSKGQSLARERQTHQVRLVGVRDERSHGRLCLEHAVRQNVKLSEILAPHQRTLERFWFDEVPEGAVHEQACHVSRRVLVGDGTLRRHEREIIVEHGLIFAPLFRLSAIESEEVADGLHHAFEHESRLLRGAVQETVGASSVGAHISFEEVGKCRGEVTIFPSVSLACDEVEQRVDVPFEQIVAQGEQRHHQPEFVLQVVDISRLVELMHHPLDGVFRLVVVEELERLDLEFCHFHFGGNLIADAFALCGAKSLEPFRIFEHVEGNAAIEFEQFHAVFRLETSFACQGRDDPLVGIGHCQ